VQLRHPQTKGKLRLTRKSETSVSMLNKDIASLAGVKEKMNLLEKMNLHEKGEGVGITPA
jgi:hypothetical protein